MSSWLVDYSSSDDEEEDTSNCYSESKLGNSSSAFGRAPPLSQRFHGMAGTRMPSLRSGHELRQHCYIYIDWMPNRELSHKLTAWVNQLQELNRSRGIPPIIDHTESLLGVPQPLHISLSENVIISPTDYELFETKCRNAITNELQAVSTSNDKDDMQDTDTRLKSTDIVVDWSQPHVFVNKQGTRQFIAFSVHCNTHLYNLVRQLNTICETYAQPDQLPSHTINETQTHITVASFDSVGAARDVSLPKGIGYTTAIPFTGVCMKTGSRIQKFTI